jgi:hypothetical protein
VEENDGQMCLICVAHLTNFPGNSPKCWTNHRPSTKESSHPLGQVRRTVFNDWLYSITELYTEVNHNRELQSEAEQMFTVLKKVRQECDTELAHQWQEIFDQQSEIGHVSSQLAKGLGGIKKSRERVRHYGGGMQL